MSIENYGHYQLIKRLAMGAWRRSFPEPVRSVAVKGERPPEVRKALVRFAVKQ